MSIAAVERRVAEEALCSVRPRLDVLESSLKLCKLEQRRPPKALDRELDSLRRIVQRLCDSEVPGRASLSARLDDLEELSRTAAQFPQAQGRGATAGRQDSSFGEPLPNMRFPPGTCIRSLRTLQMDEEEETDSDEVRKIRPGTTATVVRRGSGPSGRRIEVEVDAGYGASDRGWVSVVTDSAQKDALWENAGLAGEVAAFLYPRTRCEGDLAAAQAEVQALAAEGRLSEQLTSREVINFPSEQVSFVVRELPDDDKDDQVLRAMLLEVKTAADNVLTVQTLVQATLEEQDQGLAAVEENLLQAVGHTSQAVAALTGATSDQWQHYVWVPSAACFLAVGTAVTCTAPVGLLAAVLRAGITLGATMTTLRTTLRLTQSHIQEIQRLRERLPDVVSPMPAGHQDVFVTAGDVAAKRLLDFLRDPGAWAKASHSVWSLWNGLQVRYRPSGGHRGYAYATEFYTKASATSVFSFIKSLALAGSLETGCSHCWSANVDSKTGTFLRHLTFQQAYTTQTFACICRCARVELDGEEEQEEVASEYVFAVSSLNPALFALSGAVQPLEEEPSDEQQSTLVAGGIRICTTADGCCVEVMGDVDLVVGGCAPSWSRDLAVKSHVLQTAINLQQLVRAEFGR